MIVRLKLLWRAATRRREFESDLDAELAFHQQARCDDLVAQGVPPDEAARQARIELGMREIHRDECRRARGLDWLDNAARDLRYAWRGLRRNPGYSVTALLVLGSAIAANAMLFGLFNAYALRYPPIERVERWVTLAGTTEQSQSMLEKWSLADAEQLLREPPAMFEGLYTLRDIRLPAIADVARPAYGEAVSDNYFDLLGVQPVSGRAFRDSDEGVVVLSDIGWKRLLNADPAAIGRRIEFAGQPFTVIGVMGPEFTGLTVASSLYWITQRDMRRLRPDEADDAPRVDVGGFLREGATIAEASAAMQAYAGPRNAAREEPYRLASAQVERRRGYLRNGDLQELWSIAAPIGIAFASLLLVAAANLASLVLARFVARRRELAVRSAVGAPRRRLLSQLLTECALVALAAGVLGFALASLLIGPVHQSMLGVLGEFSVELREVGVDGRVFGYGLALSLLAAATFGGLPALLVTAPWRRNGTADIDMGSLQRAGHSLLRSALMVGQIAASVVFLVTASLIAANASQAEKTALGYDPERIVSVNLDRTDARLRDALLALPQVENAAGAAPMPLAGNAPRMDVLVGERSLALGTRWIEASYFDVMAIPRLHGRDLRRADEGTRVVAISHRTAQTLFGERNAIGERIVVPPQENLDAAQTGSYEVVSVVEDVISEMFVGGVDGSALYLPTRIGSDAMPNGILLRVRDSSHATRDAITRACVAAVPEQNCDLLPLRTALRMQHTPFLVAANAAGALGWTALGISCLGLYGLVSFLVQNKRREIGVRLALGATGGRVVRHVMRQASRQIALGIVVGLPLAFGVSRLMASLSDRLQTFDAVSFVAVPAVLAVLALLAAWIPARRTAGIAPTEVLREE